MRDVFVFNAIINTISQEFTRMLSMIMKEDYKGEKAKTIFEQVNTSEDVINDDGDPDVIASADALVTVLFSKGIFVSSVKTSSRFKLASRLAMSLRRASFVRDGDTVPGATQNSRYVEFQNLLKLQQLNRRASLEKRLSQDGKLVSEEDTKKMIVDEKDNIKGWGGQDGERTEGRESGMDNDKKEDEEYEKDEEKESVKTAPTPDSSPQGKLMIAIPK